jgi:RHS repeat-associated protein
MSDYHNVTLEHKTVGPQRTCRHEAPTFRKAFRPSFGSHLLRFQCPRRNSRTCFEGPYGNVLNSSGPLAAANVYRFSSKETHVSSGLIYYLYRLYDPAAQRWLNRDPIGLAGLSTAPVATETWEEVLGRNLYRFLDGAPINAVDGDGRVAIVPVILIGGGAFALYCVGLITYEMIDAKRNLKNGECMTFSPRCLNLIAFVTTLPGPLKVQFCRDCNGRFSANIISPEYTGPNRPVMAPVPPMI